MTRFCALIFALCAGSLCVGCVSTAPPLTYIQLSAEGVAPGASAQPSVMVDSVQLPDFLLRNELMRRDGDFAVRYDSGTRWAEPLDLGIQRVLTLRLGAELDSSAVISFPARGSSAADWRVDVTLRKFEAELERARILADVRLFSAGQDAVETWQHNATEALSSDGPADIAAALSSLLAGLAMDVASHIRAAADGN